ncbi:hypothetical protein AURDEDRAFT_151705 [Auricularia subglabra TFB-10046 SS5]|nr:hypothetical protein AURDEDRAFT_151705 [Auricularia subglabra TFB-10046 SS5]
MSQKVHIRVPDHLLSAQSSCGHSVADPVGSILLLRSSLELPDVLSRSGRKLIYTYFDDFCDQILRFCAGSESHNTGAVALTLLQIAEDTVLRRELVTRAGLLKDIWQRFLNPQLCPFDLLIGLRLAAAMLTDDVDIPAFHEPLYEQLRAVAREVLLSDRPSALPVICARALVKCIPTGNAADISSRRLAASRIIGLLDLPTKMSHPLFAEFFGRFASACRKIVSLDEGFSAPARLFLIGAACSADSVSRKRAVSCMMRMSTAKEIGATAPSYRGEVSPPVWDATVFMANYSRARRGLAGRGAEDTLPVDCRRLAYFMSRTASAIVECRETGDPVRLALALCEVIMDDPLAVCFEATCSERFGFGKNVTPRQLGFPCDEWRGILIFVARVIRTLPEYQHLELPLSSETVSVQHVVDVLTIHHAFLCGDLQEAAKLSRAAVTRAHDEMFFRYGVTLNLQSSEEVERGAQFLQDVVELNTEDVRKRILYQMMLRNLAISAFFFGIEFSYQEEVGAGSAWPIVCQSMNLAHDLAFEYVTYAPPAARDLPTMMEVHCLSAFIMFGDTQQPSPDFQRLSETYGAIVANSDSYFSNLRRHKQLASVLNLILRHGADATAEWGAILRAKQAPRDAADPLAAFRAGDSAIHAPWWSSEDENVWTALRRSHDSDHQLNWNLVPGTMIDTLLVPRFREMHMQDCAYCGEESSLLRKCAACRDVRYCSKQCQKKDWKFTHREQCTGAFKKPQA